VDVPDLTFEGFIRIWVRVALILVFVEAYLTVNKIWIRKHERIVSESVSVSAQLIALATGVPFIALYAMEGAYEGVVGDGLFLLVNLVMIAIGIGFWVEETREQSIWQRLKKSLNLEKQEANSLLANFFKPAGAVQVIRILHGLARIDNNLDAKEEQFIQAFAKEWEIDLGELFSESDSADDDDSESFTELRSLLKDYLHISPPKEQARHLRDVLAALTSIDGNVSDEEALIMTELTGLIDDYVGGTKSAPYVVLVAPQSPAQELALQELLQQHTKEQRLGGEVYTVGHYHSHAYADMVCGWYRDTGYLTINEQHLEATSPAEMA
jgi:hypothetical protein